MPLTRTPRTGWIDAGLRALATGGPDAVRVEALARDLKVSKGGFYWHFDDRGALLEELLGAWEWKGVDEVIELVEAEGGDARTKLRNLSRLAMSGEEELGVDPLLVDLAVRDWARRDKRVARRLRKVDNRRMDYMRKLFGEFCRDEDEVEVRCTLAFSLWIGNHFIAADHRGRSSEEAQGLAFERLIAE